MRARAFLPVFLFAVSLPLLAGEEKKEEAKNDIKVDLSYLEKTWGLKCKSCKITGTSPANAKFLLEFTKDVENLNELRAAFAPVYENTTRGTRVVRTVRWPLWLYFFDEENVFLLKIPLGKDPTLGGLSIEGEITGKKGDAIRVTFAMRSEDFKKVRKIEARPGEKPKDKDKAKK